MSKSEESLVWYDKAEAYLSEYRKYIQSDGNDIIRFKTRKLLFQLSELAD